VCVWVSLKIGSVEFFFIAVGAEGTTMSKIYVIFFRCFVEFILPVGAGKNKTNPSSKENGPNGQ
jgi:hypothetical protein